MAALTLKSIRLCTLALGVAVALAPSALAADVSVQLDAGAGFSVKNSTGAIERLRVDEATGNVSRNGALFVHTTGTSNLFVGPGAGNTSTSGFGFNSAFGAGALGANTTGNRNTAVGFEALNANTTGFSNTAVGYRSLRANTTGTRNTAVGRAALTANTTGDYNSAFGLNALPNNSTGDFNSAFGYSALLFNTSGYRNAAFGDNALLDNNLGSYNSAVGSSALRANTTGIGNSAVGHEALRYNTTGSRNSAFGNEALRSTTTSGANSAFGSFALRANTTGVFNSALGSYALLYNTTGVFNSAVGYGALRDNITGNDNSAVGYAALKSNTAGHRNLAVGRRAGRNQTTGSDNIYLANEGVAAESGQIKIGTAGTHTQTRIAGIRGVTTGVANAVAVLIDSAGQLGTVSSSRRVKKEIRDMGDATARLLELRPVTFRYRQEQTLPSGEPPPEYGLIAEEVAEVFPDLVVHDDAGQPFTVKYHVLAPMLLNEMQKQQHTIEAQRQEYQRQIAALTTRLARLEVNAPLGMAPLLAAAPAPAARR